MNWIESVLREKKSSGPIPSVLLFDLLNSINPIQFCFSKETTIIKINYEIHKLIQHQPTRSGTVDG